MFPIQDTIQTRSVPLVTWGIILLDALVFFYELSLPPEVTGHESRLLPCDIPVMPSMAYGNRLESGPGGMESVRNPGSPARAA